MVILLASLASNLLNERLSVGLLADANAAQAILPQFGSAHFWTILRALALLQPTPAHTLVDIARAYPVVGEPVDAGDRQQCHAGGHQGVPELQGPGRVDDER